MINQVYYDTDSTDVDSLYKPTHQELNIRDDVNLSPETFQREVIRECMLHFILADVDSNAPQYAESITREKSRSEADRSEIIEAREKGGR